MLCAYGVPVIGYPYACHCLVKARIRVYQGKVVVWMIVHYIMHRRDCLFVINLCLIAFHTFSSDLSCLFIR